MTWFILSGEQVLMMRRCRKLEDSGPFEEEYLLGKEGSTSVGGSQGYQGHLE